MTNVLNIDFNDTLMDRTHIDKGYKMGKPFKFAKESLDGFKKMGYKIVIFTDMALSHDGEKVVRKWLDYFKIPYDKITCVKEHSDFLIDDKALRFEGDWVKTFNYVRRNRGE